MSLLTGLSAASSKMLVLKPAQSLRSANSLVCCKLAHPATRSCASSPNDYRVSSQEPPERFGCSMLPKTELSRRLSGACGLVSTRLSHLTNAGPFAAGARTLFPRGALRCDVPTSRMRLPRSASPSSPMARPSESSRFRMTSAQMPCPCPTSMRSLVAPTWLPLLLNTLLLPFQTSTFARHSACRPSAIR